MEQVVFVLLATRDELPRGYTITHDIPSGRYFPRKDGQLLRSEGEALWFSDETDARIYCWEQSAPSHFDEASLRVGLGSGDSGRSSEKD